MTIVSSIIYIRRNIHYQKIAKIAGNSAVNIYKWAPEFEGAPSPFAVLRSVTSNVRHRHTQSSIVIHAEIVGSPRITYPFVPLMCTQLSLAPPDKLHCEIPVKYYEGERSFRNCQTRRWRGSMWRGIAGLRIPRVHKGGRARGRNTPIAFHGPLRGSHVRRGGSGDVGVASGAYVTCAPCARCDATPPSPCPRRPRRHDSEWHWYSHREMREHS